MQQQKDDQTPVKREDWELSAQEEAFGAQLYKTPERRHVDDLLDVSEETFVKELEPYEYHCYSQWEDAVWGWAKVAPLSCILMSQNIHRKPKRKEANNLTPLSVNPTPSNAGSSARIAEQHCKSHAGLHKKSLNQQTGSWGQTEFAVPNATQKNMTLSFFQNKTDEDGLLGENLLQSCHLSQKYFVLESRLTKPQKHSHKPNNIVVPITNFTFLPPIKSLQLNPKVSGHVCKGKKAPDAETFEENLFLFDKRSGSRRTRVEAVVNSDFHSNSAFLKSAYQKYPQNLHFISALHASVPKRYHVPVSSKPDGVYPTMGKSFSQAMPQPHMQPSFLFS
ncbi:uncharacterized protein LOC121639239 [Melanotaenia boesemani]|uniref:uncharacterized protein LOC121639239 n=1 Tax=Melanotaenia boesemani TaxID=1250792 RepID=UPI001C04A332|nr:uncharacterized protein LOC121639239 [Melanotaenia boesemani]